MPESTNESFHFILPNTIQEAKDLLVHYKQWTNARSRTWSASQKDVLSEEQLKLMMDAGWDASQLSGLYTFFANADARVQFGTMVHQLVGLQAAHLLPWPEHRLYSLSEAELDFLHTNKLVTPLKLLDSALTTGNITLVDKAIAVGAPIHQVSDYFFYSFTSIEPLLERGLSPHLLLPQVSTLEQLQLLYQYRADFNQAAELPNSANPEFWSFLLAHGMEQEQLVKKLITKFVGGYNQESWQKALQFIDSIQADLSQYEELRFHPSDHHVQRAITDLHDRGLSLITLAKNFFHQHSIAPSALQRLIALGLDLNMAYEAQESFLDAILERDTSLLQALTEAQRASLYLSPGGLGEIILDEATIAEKAAILQLLPHLPSKEDVTAFAQHHGVSPMNIHQLLDMLNLVQSYAHYTKGEASGLSLLELMLLDPEADPRAIDYLHIEYLPSGSTPLYLAVSGGKYDFARELISMGHDPYMANRNGTSLLNILGNGPNDFAAELMQALSAEEYQRLERYYTEHYNGDSPFDQLVSDPAIANSILQKSNHPIFTLVKAGDIMPLLDPRKTHIAISDDNARWSFGAWHMAKKLTYDNPNIEFHLVRKEMVEQWGDALFAQLDGILAPGGGDSYPRTKYFKKEDCSFQLTLEQLYQIMAEKAEAYQIPYLGMCAGAQHLALYHGSTLGPLNSSGQVKIDFIPGTLSHFKALNATQKEEALTQCKLLPLTVLGDTAHGFGAYPEMLGASLELGARHHDKEIAMAYTHMNGILAATQFHPEHHIGKKTDVAAPQLAWIQSFLDLAEMHHAHKHQGGVSPVEYYATIKHRLEECMAMQELDMPAVEHDTANHP